MKSNVRTNQRLMMVLIAVLSIMALYSFAGQSDQVDQLTAAQRRAVVARW